MERLNSYSLIVDLVIYISNRVMLDISIGLLELEMRGNRYMITRYRIK